MLDLLSRQLGLPGLISRAFMSLIGFGNLGTALLVRVPERGRWRAE